MPPLTNVRRERFAQLLFSEPQIPDYKHYITAGYSAVSAMTVASKRRNEPDIVSRLAELQAEVAKDNIMSVQERKEILSEIARGNLVDYQDGYTKDSPNTRSVRKMVTRTHCDEVGNKLSESSIELDDRRAAIIELNKMDGIYMGLGLDDVEDIASVASSIWSAIKGAKQEQLGTGDNVGR